MQSERISVSPGKKYNIKRFQQLGLSATAKPKSAGRGGHKKRKLFTDTVSKQRQSSSSFTQR